jgi:hypothetical protein
MGNATQNQETPESDVEKPSEPEAVAKNTTSGILETMAEARDALIKHFPKEEEEVKKAYKRAGAGGKSYGFKPEFIELANHICALGHAPYEKKFGDDFGPHCIFELPKIAHFNSMRGSISRKVCITLLDNWKHLVDLETACLQSDDHSKQFCNNWWKINVLSDTKDDDATHQAKLEAVMALQNQVTNGQTAAVKPATRVGHKIAPIIVYGTTVWDIGDPIDYDIAWNAYNYWDTLDREMRRVDPDSASRGRFYWGLNCYFNNISRSNANQIFQRIGLAMQDNPEAENECYAAGEIVRT